MLKDESDQCGEETQGGQGQKKGKPLMGLFIHDGQILDTGFVD